MAKTPLTAVILISEMTGSYGLLIPLILVATIAALLSPRSSIYREQVQSRIDSPAHLGQLAAAALANMRVADAIDEGKPARLVGHGTPLAEVAERAVRESASSFAVVDDDGKLLGLLTLSDLHLAGRETILPYLVARDLVRGAVPRVTADLDLRRAMSLLVANDQDDLLVVDRLDSARPLAILSRQDLLFTYERFARLAAEEVEA